jgi:PPP family 3-phenylpropionic acid transporter
MSNATPLTRFILLYGAMYAAFGVASPFLPTFMSRRGLLPEQLGLVLAAGTALRLLTSPLAGRVGDLIHSLRRVPDFFPRARRDRDIGLSRSAGILAFARHEFAPCRSTGADYYFVRRVGIGIGDGAEP